MLPLLAACTQDASLKSVPGPMDDPAPGVQVVPESVDLGVLDPGATGSSTVQVQSTGTAALRVDELWITGDGWSFSASELPSEVDPGTSLVVTLRFDAVDGASNGALAVETNAGTRAVVLGASVRATDTTADTGEADSAADTGASQDTGGDTGDPAPCVLASVAHLDAAGSSQVEVDADHRQIVAPAYDVGPYAEVFDADSFASIATFATGNRGNPVLIDAVGDQVWVGNPDSGSVTVVERATHAAVATLLGFQNPHSLVQDAATGTVFMGDHFAGTVTAFDPLTLEELDSATLGYGITQMSAGDGAIYVPRTDGALDVLDAATLDVLDSVTLPGRLYGSAYVDGQLFVSSFSEGQVHVLDATTLATITTTAVANPYQARASSDGALVAVAGYGDGSLNLLDAVTGDIVATAAACAGATDVAEDTTTGRWVVTCATRSGLEVLECR